MTLDDECKHKVNSERLIELRTKGSRGIVDSYIKAYEAKGCHQCSGRLAEGERCFSYNPPKWTEL